LRGNGKHKLIGSIRVVTDASGAVVWNADYQAFGQQIAAFGTFDKHRGYTGKEYEEDI